MNYKLIFRILPLSLLITMLPGCHKDTKEQNKTGEAIRVKTVTVTNGEVGENNSYSGTVEEESGTVLSFSAAGTIKSLMVSEGDNVRKGQLLGALDDGSLRSAYDMAVATLNQAKDAYKRMKILHETNSLPDIKWVEVQSKLSQAESAANIAKIALEDAKLYSPVSGVVSEKMASIGQTVAPGVPVVKIVDINSVKVGISIPENEISGFKIGSAACVTTNAVEGASYTGILVEKGVVANPLSRSYLVKYNVKNAGGKLLPGMICDVRIQDSQESKGFVLPTGAVLLAADNTHFVWVDSAGVARKRVVQPGMMIPEGIMIDSGLMTGDKVIVEGTEKVSQNTKVKSID